MPDLQDGESIQIQGSAATPYTITNTGGVYSCTCPAWRNQSLGVEKRTCKHIRGLRGDAAETARIGNAVPVARATTTKKDASGNVVAGPPLLLAHSWENDVDLTGWWMSEKLDGIRAYWDGQKMFSRLGNEILAPDWFLAALPRKMPLDGELWLERKAFQRTTSIVRRQDKGDQWKQIRYVVFDAPAIPDPFETRIRELTGLLSRIQSDFVIAHEHVECRNVDHLKAELQRVEALGGEGLMLRQPGSKYVAGRSATLLKVKTFHDDDATVIQHVAGKGRHKGRLGALVVRLPNGIEFSVGTGFSDKERENPPTLGSVITFRYQELSTGGVPRFPSYVRIRGDATAGSSGVTVSSSPVKLPASRIIVPPLRPAPLPDNDEPDDDESDEKAEDEAADEMNGEAEAPRYFTFEEGNSSKFWEIAVSGSDVTVRFGRIGTSGQTKTTSFPNATRAQAQADKLILEKLQKGYEESDSDA